MMANKTIYVADADLPLFEQAQALAGGNLSSAIASALRQFVERAQSEGAIDVDMDMPMASGDEGSTDQSGLAAIVVKVGQGGAYTLKRFNGRLLGKQHVRQAGQNTVMLYRVYQTQRGALALHIVESPDWSDWANWGDWRNWGRGKRDRIQKGRERAEERRRERGRGRDRADQWAVNFGSFSMSSSPAIPPIPPTPPAPPDAPEAPIPPEAPFAPQEDERSGSGAWWQTSSRLEVYNTFDELRPHIPAELAMVVAHRLNHGDNLIEDLDI